MHSTIMVSRIKKRTDAQSNSDTVRSNSDKTQLILCLRADMFIADPCSDVVPDLSHDC
jgi:hypothetical protein